MNDTQLGVALIGCGRRAPAFTRTFKACRGVRLVALCDRVLPRVAAIKATAAEGAAIREYTDHRRMLDDGGFDAVFVLTEPEFQAGLAVECLDAGKPVFSEVPVSYSMEDCWRLVLAVERTGLLYYLGEQVRHSPLIRYWRHLVQSDALGSILFAEGHYLHGMASDRYWRNADTGELLTWEQARQVPNKTKTRSWSQGHSILYGPHEMSPLLKVLDDRVVQVTCYSTGRTSKRYREVPFTGQFEEFPFPDLEVAMMRTAKGTVMRFAAGFQAPISVTHWYHLFGTKGEVETKRGADETGYSYFYPKPILDDMAYRVPRTREVWFHPSCKPPEDVAALLKEEVPPAVGPTGHGGIDYFPVADFIECLLHGKKPDIDVYQAVESAAPCIVAAQSVEMDGRTMTVPDFRPGPHRRKGEMPANG